MAAQNYESIVQSCSSTTAIKNLIALRQFKIKNEIMKLVVDEHSLETFVVPDRCLINCNNVSLAQVSGTYATALEQAYRPPNPLHNDGLTKSLAHRNEYFLTTDLCPSKKPLDYEFYQNLARDKKQTSVGIALSGGWMRSHQIDLKWLKELATKRFLQITWINHSDTHPYKLNVPYESNFLLTTGVNLKVEVLNAEIQFLKDGLLPSVYFRFPGLVSNTEKMSELKQLGLIPLGAAAWLARGEYPVSGNIILVHGNGNEPLGLKLFNQWVAQTGNWPLFRPLRYLFD